MQVEKGSGVCGALVPSPPPTTPSTTPPSCTLLQLYNHVLCSPLLHTTVPDIHHKINFPLHPSTHTHHTPTHPHTPTPTPTHLPLPTRSPSFSRLCTSVWHHFDDGKALSTAAAVHYLLDPCAWHAVAGERVAVAPPFRVSADLWPSRSLERCVPIEHLSPASQACSNVSHPSIPNSRLCPCLLPVPPHSQHSEVGPVSRGIMFATFCLV